MWWNFINFFKKLFLCDNFTTLFLLEHVTWNFKQKTSQYKQFLDMGFKLDQEKNCLEKIHFILIKSKSVKIKGQETLSQKLSYANAL